MRELKAVGGNLRALRVAFDGRRARPGAVAVLRALPRDEALRRALPWECASTTRPRARSSSSAAAGPVRMSSADRRLRTRPHRERAAVHVRHVAALVAARRGYDAQLVHNITDINDKIYDAAPGASAQLAAKATAWASRTPATSGLAARLRAEGDGIGAADRRVHRRADRKRERVRERGDVYFSVASFPEYGRLSG